MADAPNKDELIEDRELLSTKQKMMEKMKWHSLFMSIGDTCKFIAGPLFGIGIGAALAAGTVTGALPLALLGAATALLITGVASGYASSRIWQSGQFDNFEINAKSTADHLVEKLKENNMCLVEHDVPQRKDGKTWVQTVQPREQAGVEIGAQR